MGSIHVVAVHPRIQIGLQFLQRVVQLAPESNLIKLVQYGFMKTFADAVGLRVSGLGFGVLNTVHAKVKLIIMGFNFSAVLSASVCEYANEAHFL